MPPSRLVRRAHPSPPRPPRARTRLAPPLLAALLLAACARGSADGTAPALSSADGEGATVVLVERLDDPAYRFDPVTITAARMDRGDTLLLDLRYGGGCAPHGFRLLAQRGFRESSPVQVGARLAHDAHGDACKALLSTTLRVDLGRLRAEYATSYQTAHGAIRVEIAGVGGVTYTF